MANFKTKNVSIVGVSTAVPKNIVQVDQYVFGFGEEIVENFKKKTGIKQVHRTSEHQTASDLGYEASVKLLDHLAVDKKKIGLLIFVSQSPDYRKPATACVLQHRLGLDVECAAFDVNLGCSGFMYGHQIMQSLLQTSDCTYGLLIVAETSSKQASAKDKSIGMMFGDAGSAILYQKTEDAEDNTALLRSDGSRFRSIIVPAGGFRDMKPEQEKYIDIDGKERSKYDAYMDGLGVFTFSITDVPKAIKTYLRQENKAAEDYDYMILHQANHMIINQLAKKFKMPKEKVPIILGEYGNTSGVSIPLALSVVFGNKPQGHKKILASGFGIGLSWGVTAFVLNTENVLPVFETDSIYSEGIY